MNEDPLAPGNIHFTQAAAVGDWSIQVRMISGQQLGVASASPSGETRPRVAPADLAVLQQAFANLEAQIHTQVPTDKKRIALERIAELEEAINSPEPDLGAMGYVKRWFTRNLPQLSEAVADIISHPIVGQRVEAAGDELAVEFLYRSLANEPGLSNGF